MGYRTRIDMNEEVFDHLGETAGHITKERVDKYLKEAYSRFAEKSKSLVSHKRINILNGIGILPVDFKEPIYIDTGAVSHSARYEWTTDSIIFRPYETAPDIAILKYVALPSEHEDAFFKQLTTDESKTVLTDDSDYALIQYALSRALRYDQRTEEAMFPMKEFNDTAERIKTDSADTRRRSKWRSDAWSGSLSGFYGSSVNS